MEMLKVVGATSTFSPVLVDKLTNLISASSRLAPTSIKGSASNFKVSRVPVNPGMILVGLLAPITL